MTLTYELYNHQSIDSTNDEAKRLIASGCKSNFIITAKEQTKGRGRDGRVWSSGAGNLYMSLALCNPICCAHRHPELDSGSKRGADKILNQVQDDDNKTDFCFISGLALAQSIGTQNLFLKWPNDLILNDKKLAGILIESISNYLIIGIGVNVAVSPEDINRPATNLLKEGINIPPEKLLKNIIKNFEKYYILWKTQGFEPIRKLWLERAYRLNQEIGFNYKGVLISGIFKDIDDRGNIIIKDSTDAMYKFEIGEVLR
jgi:BirA family transcriptional regulator, biotin operon repressor / biotin---[acetyl-CoA-carboxylase] ligase